MKCLISKFPSVLVSLAAFAEVMGAVPALAGGPPAGHASSRARLQDERPKRPVFTAAAVPADAIDSIIAVVDGEPLTMSDLRAYLSSRKESLGGLAASPEEVLQRGSAAGRKVIDEMVRDKMIAREAQAANISATSEEISTYVSEVRKQNQVDEKTFDSILASKGISKEKYLEQVRDDIIRTRLIANKVRNKISIVDEDIVKASKKQRSHSDVGPGKMHLEQILLHAATNEPDDLESISNELKSDRQDVEYGSAMKDLNEEHYSDLGFVRPSDLRPELEKAARKLSAGQVTPVTCYDAVCAILRRIPDTEEKPAEEAEAPSLSDSERAQIRKELFEERFQAALEHYLKVELPEKYQVEVKW